MSGQLRKSRLLFLFVFPVLACLSVTDALATESLHTSAVVDLWGEAEGLPQSRIKAILQTQDGYLWLGTDSGLVRFNGTSFKTFTVETKSLKDNEVCALVEDDENGLWIGTYGGGLTLYKDGRFITFTRANGLPDDVILRLDKDAEGNVWIATPRGAARYLHGSFTSYTTHDGLSDNNVLALCANSPLGILVATGTSLQTLVNGRFQTIEGIASLNDGVIEHLLCGRDNTIWIAFHNAVIKKWQAGKLTTYGRGQNLTSQVYRLHEDSQGTLWVALEQGLHRLKEGRFELVPLRIGGINPAMVSSLYTDREENLWIGLETKGLARIRNRPLATLTTEDGLLNNSTRSVFKDSRNNLWIGTVGGLTKYRSDHQETFQTVEGVPLGIVRSLAEDNDGNLWIGASRQLLILQNGRLIKYPGWHSNTDIKVIYRDTQGRMWIGTDGDGLFLFEGHQFRNFRTNDGLAHNRIRSLLLDHNGALWIGTASGGLIRFAGGNFKTYTTQDGLTHNWVYALHEDEEGTLWIGTREGLSRFRDGRFFNYTTASGLLSNFVYSILDDGYGNYWFSSFQGLFRVSKSELTAMAKGEINQVNSFNYGIKDGMRTKVCNPGNQPTAWKAADGTLLFCTLQGLVIADPSQRVASELIPPVHIEDVLINKQRLSISNESAIPIGAGEFEIHFAALSYLAPERVRYKYRLVGFDQDWVDAGTRRFAYYANLAPGHYRFQVCAGNMDGPWNETGASYSFYLQPHFYQTKLFYVFIALLILLTAVLLYRLRMHEIKARYAAVLAERTRIAGEIHDTLAQNLAGIALQLDSVTMRLADVPPSLREQLDQACNLTRYSLSEARRAVVDLRSDGLEQRELSEAIPEIANRLVAAADIQTRIDVAGAPRPLPPLIEKNLLRIYQEAVANVVKHSQAHQMEVELCYGAKSLTLQVQDDGQGFDTGKIIPLGVGHYGLTGMRERAERIGGLLHLQSQPGNGTKLLIEVPYPRQETSRRKA